MFTQKINSVFSVMDITPFIHRLYSNVSKLFVIVTIDCLKVIGNFYLSFYLQCHKSIHT